MSARSEIVIDCDKMKYANTGLFSFCYYLVNSLYKIAQSENEMLTVFAPSRVVSANHFDLNIKYINGRIWDKVYLKVPSQYKIWHSTFQMSKYWPVNSLGTVLTIHDLNFLYHRKDKDYDYCMKKIKKNIERADKIVAISEFSKKDIIQHLDLFNKKVEVIYNGCNYFHGELSAPKEPQIRPFLFSVGTILPKKNFHVLPCLLKGNDFDLIIAGNRSAYCEDIMNEARKWNVADRVKIVGPIDEGLKHWYLKNCYAFVYPSIAEGFGLPVVEAMNYGVPVFLSRHTSLPEVGGEFAVYFNREFDPELMQLEFFRGLNLYNNMPEMKNKIRERAMKFSWDKAAEQYWSIYNEMS